MTEVKSVIAVRQIGWILGILLATAMVAVMAIQGPAAASNGEVLVYAGNGGFSQGYEDFGQATGKTIDTQLVFPDDLSRYDCVILPVNSLAFSQEIKQDLLNYLNAGGRVFALAEHGPFPGSIATMNDLASFVGADLQVNAASIDPGFNDTDNIDPSPFTVGVNTIRYAATSEVEVLVGPDALSLVRTMDGGAAPGTTFIAVDMIGSGIFVLSGDSNPFSDGNGGGYVEADNGVLAANLCDQAPVEPPVEPKEGFMTGGGHTTATDPEGTRVTFGLRLECDAADEPNNFQVNWGQARDRHNFHLEEMTAALCSDTSEDPSPPDAGFDTHMGSGTGRYNGESGATAEWRLTDRGQPGRNDTVELTITDAGGDVVLQVSGNLEGGNLQAH